MKEILSQSIIIIGTLHDKWTPVNELRDTLNELNPDKVLIELSKEELRDRPREDSIRDEMFAAYDWAIENSKQVDVFDVEVSTLKKGVTGKELNFIKLENKVKKLLKEYSWKDLNNLKPWNISEVTELEDKIVEKYFDKDKMREREFKMLNNLNKLIIDGKNVIIIGTGHLTFFQEQIPDAKLIFRK